MNISNKGNFVINGGWRSLLIVSEREREREREGAVSVGCQGVVVSSRHPPTNKQENLYYLTMWLSVIKGVDIIHFLLMKFSFLLPMRRKSEVTREESE